MPELKPSSVRAQMAWVPQEPVLFSGTVRHNLLLGWPEASDHGAGRGSDSVLQ